MTESASTLEDRLRALAEAADAGEGQLPGAHLAAARAIHDRAEQRLGLGGEHTVVALAGATGSGKSSLFNALIGEDLSTVGVRRPTTASAQACIWGGGDADPLLNWVGVPRRHAMRGGDPALAGLVLLDLPDHDSVEVSHRVEVDRLLRVVDLMVWVLDPQKYADAAVHDHYLAPMASHAEVMLVTLSQVDRLTPADLQRCLDDLRGLLTADGLPQVPVLAVSSTTGAGVAELRQAVADRVAGRRATVERLSADLGASVRSLARFCGPPAPDAATMTARTDVVPALAAAAGVGTVVSAVDRAHRTRAAATAGWPPVRWVRRLRADPLRRLRLSGPAATAGGRTSLPTPTPADRARVAATVRQVSDDLSAELPEPWPTQVRSAALRAQEQLPDALDRAVATTDLGADRRPRWWSVVGVVQSVLLAVALAGLLWLAGLVAWSYLQLGSLPVPHVGRVPVPTLLLFGGLLAGLLLALLSRRLAAVGARRRARVARRRLHEQIAHAVELTLVAAVAEVLTRYSRFCDAVARAADAGERSGSRRWRR